MVQPADTLSKLFLVTDAAGAAVTGLTLASNFTFTAWSKTYGGSWATYSSSPTVTEIGSGYYSVDWSSPSNAGWWAAKISANSASHFLDENKWQGEMENQDGDSIFGSVARPIVRVTGSGTLGQITSLELIADRYASRTWTFVDANGDPVDVSSDYSNYALSVRSEDQTTTVWDGTNGSPLAFGLTASSNALTATFPEDATFFSAIATGATQPVKLFYEITGDLGGDTAKTVALVQSSPLLLYRSEVGT